MISYAFSPKVPFLRPYIQPRIPFPFSVYDHLPRQRTAESPSKNASIRVAQPPHHVSSPGIKLLPSAAWEPLPRHFTGIILSGLYPVKQSFNLHPYHLRRWKTSVKRLPNLAVTSGTFGPVFSPLFHSVSLFSPSQPVRLIPKLNMASWSVTYYWYARSSSFSSSHELISNKANLTILVNVAVFVQTRRSKWNLPNIGVEIAIGIFLVVWLGNFVTTALNASIQKRSTGPGVVRHGVAIGCSVMSGFVM